jgi:hypothetical protein
VKLRAKKGEIPSLQGRTGSHGGDVKPPGAESPLNKGKEGVSQSKEIAKGRPDQGGAFHRQIIEAASGNRKEETGAFRAGKEGASLSVAIAA